MRQIEPADKGNCIASNSGACRSERLQRLRGEALRRALGDGDFEGGALSSEDRGHAHGRPEILVVCDLVDGQTSAANLVVIVDDALRKVGFIIGVPDHLGIGRQEAYDLGVHSDRQGR